MGWLVAFGIAILLVVLLVLDRPGYWLLLLVCIIFVTGFVVGFGIGGKS